MMVRLIRSLRFCNIDRHGAHRSAGLRAGYDRYAMPYGRRDRRSGLSCSAQAPDPMPAPCKGTMPGCADTVRMRAPASALPTHVTATSHGLIWTLAAYGAVADLREGLSVQPDLVPPIAI